MTCCRPLRLTGSGDIRFHPASERKLLQHPWPGNIRELENAIHYALLVCRDDVVQEADLHLSSLQLHPRVQERDDSALPEPVATLEQALSALFEQGRSALFEHIEEVVMRAAYNHCDRNQVQAARMLGISRNVIRARLIKMGEIAALR